MHNPACQLSSQLPLEDLSMSCRVSIVIRRRNCSWDAFMFDFLPTQVSEGHTQDTALRIAHSSPSQVSSTQRNHNPSPHQSTAVIQAAQLLVIHPAGLSPSSVKTSTALSHHILRSFSSSPAQTAYHLPARTSGPALQASPPGSAETPVKMKPAEWRIQSAASVAAVRCAARVEGGVEGELARSW